MAKILFFGFVGFVCGSGCHARASNDGRNSQSLVDDQRNAPDHEEDRLGFGRYTPATAEPTEYVTLPTDNPADVARASAALRKQPLLFERNEGQFDPRVKFVVRQPNLKLFLTEAGAIMTITDPTRRGTTNRRHATERILRFAVLGATRHPTVVGGDEVHYHTNYLIGNDRDKWHTDVRNFAKVIYGGIKPGVDLVYHSSEAGKLEYDFVAQTGVEVSELAMEVQGADDITVNEADGSLAIRVGHHTIEQLRPLVYQQDAGVRTAIDGRYLVRTIGSSRAAPAKFRTREIAFAIADYDHTKTLVIDPITLLGGTTGGSGATYYAQSIAVDGSGNAYVTGYTTSSNFPTTAGAYQTQPGGSYDAFVTKFGATGTTLSYSTYLGGAGYDSGLGIAVDGSDNVYMTGQTQSSNFPTTAGAYQTTQPGGPDAFVTKLGATGATLGYSTYLGGAAGNDYGLGIAVDGSGNAYVTGYTTSSNFPTTAGAYQTTQSGGGYDAFVTKVAATGATLGYSTYLGGASNDNGYSVAVDGSGNAYVTGSTQSSNFPTTAGAYQTTQPGGGADAFVTMVAATGATLGYSIYLGGSASNDYGYGIAVDGSGNAYVTGYTQSSNFPTTAGAYQTTMPGGGYDAFVTKVVATGATLGYSTYLGGANAADYGYGIAVDGSGNAYVTGYTQSSNFPTTAGAYQTTMPGGGYDAFITKVAATGATLGYSTYLGGSANEDSSYGIAVDGSGNAYVTGYTQSSNFPTTAGAYQTTMPAAGIDAFVTKIGPAGATLGYSTYLGGVEGDDTGYGVAVDGSGNAYVTGYTESSNFPTTSGAYQTTQPGGTYDAFVTKIASNLQSLSYSTYLGGAAYDYGEGIAVDSAGSAYVVGYTSSTNFPTTASAFQTSFQGTPGTLLNPIYEAFVTKLATNGQSLAYSTYVSGSNGDGFGQGIAIDSAGAAYIVGGTSATNFPTTASAYQTALQGSHYNAFVSKVASNGQSLSFYRSGGQDGSFPIDENLDLRRLL